MRLVLMEAMAQYPSQSANPKYDGSDYPDDYCKVFELSFRDSSICYCLSLELVVNNTLITSTGAFQFFLPGLSRIRPKEALRIYNKIGRAYGFTIDNSYVVYIPSDPFIPGYVCMHDMIF